MDIQLTLSFFVAAFLLALMPGPDNIFVLTESIVKGAKNGVAISFGLCSGVLVHTMAAATGLSLVLQSSDIAFAVVKWLGAGYLLYLAFLTWQEEAQTIEFSSKDERSFHFWRLFQTGFLMNVLNPKVSLFFIALLPQFVSPTGFLPSVQMAVLGLIFMLTSLVTFCSIALLSGRLGGYLQHERFWVWTKWVKVLVLMGLAVMLIFSIK